jgi:beta-glucanase (GH16 family)
VTGCHTEVLNLTITTSSSHTTIASVCDSYVWSVNGQTYSRIESHDPRLEGKAWPFNAPHYLITNLAIGGWFAGDVDPALNEAIFEVKSINVYSVDGIGSVALA